MARRYFLILLAALLAFPLSVATPQVHAQDGATDLLTISVEAGYDGRFRPNRWFPLRVEVENQGTDISGRLLVRPETTGDSLYNTFSTPVDIASGTTQTIYLYVTARSTAQSMRVELMTESGEIAGSNTVAVRNTLPRDRIYAVLSGSTTGSVDLSPINIGGYESFQTNWSIDEIPTLPSALESIDVILFTEIDTGELTPSQQAALRQWIIRGGHLIVTGGTDWQGTAAGVSDLLPYLPDGSTPTTDLSGLQALAGRGDAAQLTGEVIRAEGELQEGAFALAEDEEGTPLVARHYLGSGTVDYLTVDLSNQALRGWDGLNDMWITMLSSVRPVPAWTGGFSDYSDAITAVEILPGVSLLPAAIGLIGFLVAYVVLIGPVNYLILNRLNRRELAWITIPVFIVIFSGLAWSFGAELRGNQATLSRLSVVQTWNDSETAHVDQLIGLLAPRRGDYTLTVDEERILRPINADLNDNVFVSNQANVEIRQGNTFEAVDFPVDASFIAAFNAEGTVPKPDIGGRLAMDYTDMTLDEDDGAVQVQTLQGTIFNNADFTLAEPVILARGLAYRLGAPLEPGDLITLDDDELILPGTSYASPSPLEMSFGDDNPFIGSAPTGFTGTLSTYSEFSTRTVREILGDDNFEQASFGISLQDDEETQERRRRSAFLTSMILDQYTSTARGNQVYLVGWGSRAPTEEAVDGAGYEVSDSTLYIIELDVTLPDSGTVTVTQDQFVWVSRSRQGVGDLAPNNISLVSGTELVFRFTPLPGARLSRVDELAITLDFPNRIFSTNSIEVRNWETGGWELVEFESVETLRLTEDFEQYIGPLNAVEVRLVRENIEGQVYIQNVGVEQTGRL